MKYGIHAGHSVAKILQDKRQDLNNFGYFLWGYGGTACYPTTQVQLFAKEASSPLHLAMSLTKSAHRGPAIEATEYSADNKKWSRLPKGIHIYGSSLAIWCNDLVECNYELNPNEYEVAVGDNRGKRLSEYIQGQSSKACIRRRHSVDAGEPQSKLYTIELQCSVISPHAVFVR